MWHGNCQLSQVVHKIGASGFLFAIKKEKCVLLTSIGVEVIPKMAGKQMMVMMMAGEIQPHRWFARLVYFFSLSYSSRSCQDFRWNINVLVKWKINFLMFLMESRWVFFKDDANSRLPPTGHLMLIAKKVFLNFSRHLFNGACLPWHAGNRRYSVVCKALQDDVLHSKFRTQISVKRHLSWKTNK